VRTAAQTFRIPFQRKPAVAARFREGGETRLAEGEGEWRSTIAGPGAASARGPSPRMVRSADPAPRASREAGDPGGDIVDALAPHGIRRDAVGSHDAGRDSALDLYSLADARSAGTGI